jgi:SAM-dependent methyltransferase
MADGDDPQYGPATYGDRFAPIYDARYAAPTAARTEATVAFLAALAGPGPALELGIGTGRVAFPLQARGVAVHGIDASAAMVAKLREKPGGASLPVTVGDMADVPVAPGAGPFVLIYVVANTFFGLLTQEDQVRCFQNVARHLAPGGAFVLDAFVPDPARYRRGQDVWTDEVGVDRLTLHAARHDPATQRISSQMVEIDAGGVRLYPVQIRYAWPSELDLMARLAGLRLRERWASWQRAPFGPGSAGHVSLYERAGEEVG